MALYRHRTPSFPTEQPPHLQRLHPSTPNYPMGHTNCLLSCTYRPYLVPHLTMRPHPTIASSSMPISPTGEEQWSLTMPNNPNRRLVGTLSILSSEGERTWRTSSKRKSARSSLKTLFWSKIMGHIYSSLNFEVNGRHISRP